MSDQVCGCEPGEGCGACGGVPRKWSSFPCPTGQPAYRDEWVGFVGGADDHGQPFRMCPACLNWHDSTQDVPPISTFRER